MGLDHPGGHSDRTLLITFSTLKTGLGVYIFGNLRKNVWLENLGNGFIAKIAEIEIEGFLFVQSDDNSLRYFSVAAPVAFSNQLDAALNVLSGEI